MKPWNRAIILIDMDAFFATVEQMDFPELQDKPVVVTNGDSGTCIITASYEARYFGIKTGMRLPEAKRRCPKLIVRASRPERYVSISSNIMAALETITPDVEVFSIDEAFLDVTHCQKLWGHPHDIGLRVKNLVQETAGVTCSVGVSGDKSTAKFAAKQHKPNGLTVIPPDEARARLKNVPVGELCGIGPGVSRFLAARGVYHCGQMQKLPIGVMAKRFGNLGRRFWLMCQGEDPSPVEPRVKAVKSLGHGKVLPPNTRELSVIKTYLRYLSEKLAKRLRVNQLEAQCFWVGFRQRHTFQWLAQKLKLALPGHHGADIYHLALQYLMWVWHGEPLIQLQITALDPRPEAMQPDLFQTTMGSPSENVETDKTMDAIQQRFGGDALKPAAMLKRPQLNDVIAPAWRPTGVRMSVEGEKYEQKTKGK